MSAGPTTVKIRRFRTNPVEIAVFAVVSVLFTHSLYSLFYDSKNYNPAALTALNPTPAADRAPASVNQALLNLDFSCDKSAGVADTRAMKVRLAGKICLNESQASAVADDEDEAAGRAPAHEANLTQMASLTQATVVNTANQFKATVFTDLNAGKFSTEYIPLESGKNEIEVKFTFADGSQITRKTVLSKN